MRPFTLHWIVESRSVNDFDIGLFDGLCQASAYAALMMNRYGYDSVEVVDGDLVSVLHKARLKS